MEVAVSVESEAERVGADGCLGAWGGGWDIRECQGEGQRCIRGGVQRAKERVRAGRWFWGWWR